MSDIRRPRLQIFGLPEINSLEDLSLQIHLSKGLLYRLIAFPEMQYRSYKIKKPRGGHRHIHQPSYELKAVQAWILRNILDRLSSSSASKGFETGQSIVHNAQPHIGAKAIMCLDIDDFFPSVPAYRVYFVFTLLGYSSRISANLTSLCTYDGYLPQGAPTSPKLANLVCWRMDKRLMGYAGKRRIIYTRYADDLTFSSFSDTNLRSSLPFIRFIIKNEGFQLNPDKWRYMGPSRRHKVTGLIIHPTGVGIGRQRYRELRAQLHSISQAKDPEAVGQELSYLQGYIAFVRGVDPHRYERIKAYIGNLNQKNPDTPIVYL